MSVVLKKSKCLLQNQRMTDNATYGQGNYHGRFSDSLQLLFSNSADGEEWKVFA